MRFLAIDHGTKRTGLAICDADETIASPLAVLHNPGDLIDGIRQVVVAEHAEAVVVGLPLNMDGSEGPQARQVRAFAKKLAECVGVPVHFQDERLSSFGAEQKWQETGLGRRRKRDHLDALAAAEILQAFLEQRDRG